MNIKLKICDKCTKNNLNLLLSKLKKLTPDIHIGCHNNCALSKNKLFVLVNHKPVQADSIDELIGKIKNL